MSDDSGVIPYGRQWVDAEDIAAVVEVLKSDWLTTGPKVAELESNICRMVNVSYGVAVSSGTSALHCAVAAAGILPGDEVIVPPITFAASANCVLYQGATPVFADVNYEDMLLSAAEVESHISKRTRAVIAVDYAGQPCDYPALRELCDKHDLVLIADCAHSLGASLHQKSSAAYADIATYSFHPVKHITSGEGGMVVTGHSSYADKMRRFRNHGIDVDHAQRAREGAWLYGMVDLGFNYRISDFQCALASSQLKKLHGWLQRRREIAKAYDGAFTCLSQLDPLRVRSVEEHAYHLYVLRLSRDFDASHRQRIFDELRARKIGVNVHYLPVYQHPYYQANVNGSAVQCENAETAFDRILSLPMYSAMSDEQVERVITAVLDILPTLR